MLEGIMSKSKKNTQRSWLEGPEIPGAYEDPTRPSSYPGESFNLPQEGPGSLSSLFPRMMALLADWLAAGLIALLLRQAWSDLGDQATVTLLVFFFWRLFTVWLFAQTPGHALLGIGVARVDKAEQRVGFVRSLVRIVLTCFILPPIVQDTDGRGLHDRATGTAVIKSR